MKAIRCKYAHFYIDYYYVINNTFGKNTWFFTKCVSPNNGADFRTILFQTFVLIEGGFIFYFGVRHLDAAFDRAISIARPEYESGVQTPDPKRHRDVALQRGCLCPVFFDGRKQKMGKDKGLKPLVFNNPIFFRALFDNRISWERQIRRKRLIMKTPMGL